MSSKAPGFRSIAAEAVLIAAGGRAILLQLANPAVGRGVAEHSDFESRPLDRLHATLTYAYAVVYGNEAESDYVRHVVNRAHAPVHGGVTSDDESSSDNPSYNAFDPALQLWVAATLYESAITMYERIFGTLEPLAAERIYREYAILGTALQVPSQDWPATRADFTSYWRAQEDLLTVSESTRALARQLLYPVAVPWYVKAAMPLARLTTAGLLPGRLRYEYGLRWRPRDQRRFDRLVRVTAAIYPRLPTRIRHGVRDRYLTLLRRQMTANPMH